LPYQPLGFRDYDAADRAGEAPEGNQYRKAGERADVVPLTGAIREAN
jgi:hypothetical protein